MSTAGLVRRAPKRGEELAGRSAAAERPEPARERAGLPRRNKTQTPPSRFRPDGVCQLPVSGTPPSAESLTPALGDDGQDVVFVEEDILLVVDFDLRA